jgi:hypothetical protein
LSSSPARAAKTCGGNLIFTKDLRYKKQKIGELDLYWDGATKKNCALLMHSGAYQAGPVSLKAAHRCVYAVGDIRVRPAHWIVVGTGLYDGPGADDGPAAHFCK